MTDVLLLQADILLISHSGCWSQGGEQLTRGQCQLASEKWARHKFPQCAVIHQSLGKATTISMTGALELGKLTIHQ